MEGQVLNDTRQRFTTDIRMYSWWEQNIYALLFWLTDPGSRYDFIVLAPAIAWLINSYLAFCFLSFAFCFFKDNVTAIRCKSSGSKKYGLALQMGYSIFLAVVKR